MSREEKERWRAHNDVEIKEVGLVNGEKKIHYKFKKDNLAT